MVDPLGILLLAAGKGQRFKAAGGVGNKLLAPYADAAGQQRPLLALTLAQAAASGLPLHLVTRPQSEAIVDLAQQFGATVTLLESGGSGDSIAAGVQATANWRGWLVAPADMAWLSADDYLKVAAALVNDNAQARLMWRDIPGHPVGFGRAYFAGLSVLRGDQGARQLLLPQYLQLLPGHAGVIKDADLPRP
ncbi:NTP transferase domain-containing protein [Shewanella yunxiaonensis]|uniref:NTP transferase domain-containing protein n=1 Tax=Shewanella yunxiaonensis TaxID=2829809 RepID=A0ABX7YUB7_9GAMM|nr:NTP transferase domain-containing protein [Shewanella yunxiaonensis]QUN06235.1 NTP transferase domain-containing protein [Shewanella yunxiaonensis]